MWRRIRMPRCKTIYLWTPTKARIEQALDTVHNAQPLFIVDGKDGWFIDEVAKTGKHLVDPSTDHTFYAPIVPLPDNQMVATNDQIAQNLSRTLRGFEIGHELAFMHGQNVSPQAVTENGTKYFLYSCAIQNFSLRLYLSAGTAVPAKSEVWRDGKFLLRIVYLEYKSLPADSALFQPPSEIRIVEAQPGTTSQK